MYNNLEPVTAESLGIAHPELVQALDRHYRGVSSDIRGLREWCQLVGLHLGVPSLHVDWEDRGTIRVITYMVVGPGEPHPHRGFGYDLGVFRATDEIRRFVLQIAPLRVRLQLRYRWNTKGGRARAERDRQRFERRLAEAIHYFWVPAVLESIRRAKDDADVWEVRDPRRGTCEICLGLPPSALPEGLVEHVPSFHSIARPVTPPAHRIRDEWIQRRDRAVSELRSRLLQLKPEHVLDHASAVGMNPGETLRFPADLVAIWKWMHQGSPDVSRLLVPGVLDLINRDERLVWFTAQLRDSVRR